MSEHKEIDQKFIDWLYNVTILIHEDPWFKEGGKKKVFKEKPRRDRAEVQQWVAQKLAERGIYTIPVGSSWGSMCDQEFYNKHKEEDV
jgi:hypothetical protein